MAADKGDRGAGYLDFDLMEYMQGEVLRLTPPNAAWRLLRHLRAPEKAVAYVVLLCGVLAFVRWAMESPVSYSPTNLLLEAGLGAVAGYVVVVTMVSLFPARWPGVWQQYPLRRWNAVRMSTKTGYGSFDLGFLDIMIADVVGRGVLEDRLYVAVLEDPHDWQPLGFVLLEASQGHDKVLAVFNQSGSQVYPQLQGSTL